jgi:hypothetical protein
MPVQRIQGGRPEYNEPQTIMKLHAFKSSLVIVCPQKVECACETLSTRTPRTRPPPPMSSVRRLFPLSSRTCFSSLHGSA